MMKLPQLCSSFQAQLHNTPLAAHCPEALCQGHKKGDIIQASACYRHYTAGMPGRKPAVPYSNATSDGGVPSQFINTVSQRSSPLPQHSSSLETFPLS